MGFWITVNIKDLLYQGIVLPFIHYTDIGLTDIWHLVNPTEREYAFFSHCHKSHSRIDFFFLVSNSINEQVVDCKTGAIVLSDHAMVELDISLNTEAGRKGRLRLNTALLQD